METVNLSLTTEQTKTINKLISRYGFASRSEFFRSLLRLLVHRPEVLIEADELVFEPPSTRRREEIVRGFRRSGHYRPEFLTDLAEGLKESDYFQ